jgi:peptidyl-tRNA hydrolase, PTH1 family
MKLIVGLGNPGEKYENTRHNFGFWAVDQLLKDKKSADNTVWSKSDKVKSEIAKLDDIAILAKPVTYMNNSGMAVSLLASYYKIEPEDIWIVYDELDLPIGSMKIRFGGAAAGHHGVESILEKLGTDKFWRFRLGIGTSHAKDRAIGRQTLHDAEGYVLGSFQSGDQGKVKDVIKHASKALQLALEKDIEAAMNRFNTK